MKLTKEMKVWIKQAEVRKKSCEEGVRGYYNQILLLKRSIALEKEQIELIQESVDEALKEWGIK